MKTNHLIDIKILTMRGYEIAYQQYMPKNASKRSWNYFSMVTVPTCLEAKQKDYETMVNPKQNRIHQI